VVSRSADTVENFELRRFCVDGEERFGERDSVVHFYLVEQC
jgi:hypothetical protein